jgi:predicted nucleic acid-binding protein
MILLDTNVVSELMRLRPEPTVSLWLKGIPREECWTSSVVVAELLSGIESMPSGRKQRALREAIDGMIAEDFSGQILSFDLDSARRYGQILSARQRIGRPISQLDAQIAAIAQAHKAILATRNTRDFEHCGIELADPWRTG